MARFKDTRKMDQAIFWFRKDKIMRVVRGRCRSCGGNDVLVAMHDEKCGKCGPQLDAVEVVFYE